MGDKVTRQISDSNKVKGPSDYQPSAPNHRATPAHWSDVWDFELGFTIGSSDRPTDTDAKFISSSVVGAVCGLFVGCVRVVRYIYIYIYT